MRARSSDADDRRLNPPSSRLSRSSSAGVRGWSSQQVQGLAADIFATVRSSLDSPRQGLPLGERPPYKAVAAP